MPCAKPKLPHLLAYLTIAEDGICLTEFASITALSLDSRLTNANTLFLAVKGTQSTGHNYIGMAAKNGCKLAFLDTTSPEEHGVVSKNLIAENGAITCVFIYDLQQKLADIAYCFYTGKSAQALDYADLPKVTAVTGTNGKTSVASLVAQLLSICDQPSASIGTLGVNLFTHGEQQKLSDTVNTTPDIVSLIATLVALRAKGCNTAVLEASSHGLAQNRLNKLFVGCAVFTNLSQDHLDYHGSMAAYGRAKRLLLKSRGLNTLVLNANDKESLQWLANADAQQSIFWFSLQALTPQQHGCWASDVNYSTQGFSFVLHAQFPGFKAQQKITAPLIGAFNVANLTCAMTTLLAQGYSFTKLVSATNKISAVAGRMELFASTKASLLVDYAHTPDALKQALIAARVHTKGRLSCVFGCGGNRDVSKRAIMGTIAQQYADNIVLTQDNSRNEDPNAIVADIKKGIQALGSHQILSVELNRERAVTQAWQASKCGDMILLAGKGHEAYIEINSQRIPYNERDVVRMLIKNNAAEVCSASAHNTSDNTADNTAGPQ